MLPSFSSSSSARFHDRCVWLHEVWVLKESLVWDFVFCYIFTYPVIHIRHYYGGSAERIDPPFYIHCYSILLASGQDGAPP